MSSYGPANVVSDYSVFETMRIFGFTLWSVVEKRMPPIDDYAVEPHSATTVCYYYFFLSVEKIRIIRWCVCFLFDSFSFVP